jgi:hypothetical protein
MYDYYSHIYRDSIRLGVVITLHFTVLLAACLFVYDIVSGKSITSDRNKLLSDALRVQEREREREMSPSGQSCSNPYHT